MSDLTALVALITGAGKGSGRILAKALAERGVSVAANDISPVNVEGAVDEINVASMNGLDEFTRQAARELSLYGIRVYAVESARDKIVERVFALLNAYDE